MSVLDQQFTETNHPEIGEKVYRATHEGDVFPFVYTGDYEPYLFATEKLAEQAACELSQITEQGDIPGLEQMG